MAARAVTKLEGIADGFLHSRDQYSHLFARLTALTSSRYAEVSLWNMSSACLNGGRGDAHALQQFGRPAFVNRGAHLARKLGTTVQDNSPSCSAPTGSGKRMATLAIVREALQMVATASRAGGARTGHRS